MRRLAGAGAAVATGDAEVLSEMPHRCSVRAS